MTEHDPQHEERIHRLVEATLTGTDRLSAEQSLLECPRCLEEFNRYSRLWRMLTRPDYAQARDQYLATANPERYRLYHRMLERIMIPDPGSAEGRLAAAWLPRWVSGTAWRTLAWGCAAVCVVVSAVLIYQVVNYRRLSAEILKKDQQLQAMQATLAQLHQRIAVQPKGPEKSPGQNAELAELRQRADQLLLETQKQSRTIQELHQRQAKYRQPSPESVLVVALSTPRPAEPEDIPTVKLSKDTWLVGLQIRISKEIQYGRYRLAVKDSAQRVVWRCDDTRPAAGSPLICFVPGDKLRTGVYTLETQGLAGGVATPISQSRFQVAAAP